MYRTLLYTFQKPKTLEWSYSESIIEMLETLSSCEKPEQNFDHILKQNSLSLRSKEVHGFKAQILKVQGNLNVSIETLLLHEQIAKKVLIFSKLLNVCETTRHFNCIKIKQNI